MFCPRCQAEYRPGFTHCADCEVDLVDSLTEARPIPQEPRHRLKSVPIFAIHQFIGALGVVYLSNFMVIMFGNPRSLRWMLTATPYCPIQIAMGLSFGFTLYRRFRHRSMLWVWVLPFAILGYAVIALPTVTPDMPSVFTPSSSLSHYFGWGCKIRDGCYDQIIITLPFYAAAAYSIGAALALRTYDDAGKND